MLLYTVTGQASIKFAPRKSPQGTIQTPSPHTHVSAPLDGKTCLHIQTSKVPFQNNHIFAHQVVAKGIARLSTSRMMPGPHPATQFAESLMENLAMMLMMVVVELSTKSGMGLMAITAEAAKAAQTKATKHPGSICASAANKLKCMTLQTKLGVVGNARSKNENSNTREGRERKKDMVREMEIEEDNLQG
jgi:hypothetical protein